MLRTLGSNSLKMKFKYCSSWTPWRLRATDRWNVSLLIRRAPCHLRFEVQSTFLDWDFHCSICSGLYATSEYPTPRIGKIVEKQILKLQQEHLGTGVTLSILVSLVISSVVFASYDAAELWTPNWRRYIPANGFSTPTKNTFLMTKSLVWSADG